MAQTNVNAECIANDKDFNDTVSLVDLDARTAHLVECLAAAGEETSAMKTVEIVSGGSRVLAVKKFVAAKKGKGYVNGVFLRALRSAVTGGKLVQVKGSYKLAAKAKAAPKKKAAPKVRRPLPPQLL